MSENGTHNIKERQNSFKLKYKLKKNLLPKFHLSFYNNPLLYIQTTVSQQSINTIPQPTHKPQN